MQGLIWIALGMVIFSAQAGARPLCSQIHQTSVAVSSKQGAQFLHEIDSRLHTSQLVQKSVKKAVGDSAGGLKPKEKIDLTLERFSRLLTRAQTSVLAAQTLKKIVTDNFVIQTENFTQRYFDFRLEILRQNEPHATMTPTRRQAMVRLDQEVQKQSLDAWMDYFISVESSHYPTWMKFWFFQGVVKLSKFEPSKASFGKRSKDTVAAFPELNKEALEMVSNWIVKRFHRGDRGNVQKADQIQFDQLSQSTSFGELYSSAYKRMVFDRLPRSSWGTVGEWKKFSRGSDPEKLVSAIENCRGDWCIRETPTARDYLQKGDMYVYFQPDQGGQTTVPVLTIRMVSGLVREVRGTSQFQNIDLNSVSPQVVTQKIRELGFDTTVYEKMADDAIRFEKIDQKHHRGQDLSIAELRFLYHFDGIPHHFGSKPDPRRQQILSQRDPRADIVTILQGRYRPEEVALNFNDFLLGGRKVYVGPLTVNSSHRQLVDSLDIVVGDFKFQGEADGGALNFPKLILGKFWLPDLTRLEGIILPESIMENFVMSSLQDGQGLHIPKDIRGEIKMDLLQRADDLVIPSGVRGVHFANLAQVKSIYFPSRFDGNIHLPRLHAFQRLMMPQELNGSLILDGLSSAIGMRFPSKLAGSLSLRGLQSAEGLTLTTDWKGGALHLDGMTSAAGLRLPEGFKMSISLDGLTSVEGLELPRTLGAGVSLGALTSIQGLSLPDRIQGSLLLPRIRDLSGNRLPQGILGELNLKSLETAQGLVLPEGLSAQVKLLGLKSIEGLSIPAGFTGRLSVNENYISAAMLQAISQ